MTEELKDRRYLLSEAAQVTGLTTNTMRSWLQRKHIVIYEDQADNDPSERSGLPHRLSFRSVMRFALMAKLVNEGVHPSRAFKITRAFLDVGEATAAFVGPGEIPPIGRLPGELFKEGRTFLIVIEGEETGKVINVKGQATVYEFLFRIDSMVGNRSVFTAVDMNKVYQELVDALKNLPHAPAELHPTANLEL